MKLQVTVLTGGRAGITAVFSQDQVSVGRHPASDLPLHADEDLDVSGHHAVFVRSGTRWAVRDVGSRNGTLVNGHPIRAETVLDDTDQVRLGRDGPQLEIRLVPDGVPDRKPEPAAITAQAGARALRQTSGVRLAQPGPPPAPSARPAPAPRGPSATQRIRVEVGRQTRTLRILTGILVLVIVGGAGFWLVERRQQAAERERERAQFQARIDSIITASTASIASLRGEMEGLAAALRQSQDHVQTLQGELASAEAAGSTAEVARLRRELRNATQAMSLQQAAARVDFQAIHRARNLAVAMIWVEFEDGAVETGTAFAVTADGVLITNRHVLAGADGTRRARRLAVQFSNSAQVWRATALGASREADVAALRVQGIVGAVPTIPLPERVDTRPGDPVAVIGFPLGTDLPMRAQGEQNLVRTTLTAGTVSKALQDLLQIDGYGAPGASGSPIFDASGALLGVLYGGEPGSNGRIVYAVPVPYVTALLRELGIALP
jgi:S1-C subfamily serine protease